MPRPIKYPGGYRVNFRIGGRDGQHVRRRFPRVDHADPKKEAQDYIDRKLAGEPAGTDLSDRVQAYLNHAEKIQRKSPKTLRGDVQRLRLFERWCVDNKVTSMSKISTQTIRDFQEYYYTNAPFTDRPFLRRKPNTPATWEKYRQIVSTFLKWCLDRSYIRVHPMARQAEFRVKPQKTIPRAMRPEETAALFTYFDQRDTLLKHPYHRAFFSILIYAGVRLDEARTLLWKDVDMKAGVIRVVKSKNKDVRTIPIHPELKRTLSKLPKTTLVFDNGKGEPLYAGVTWLKALYAATDALNLPAVRLHDFRHTFGATLAMNGVPLPTIMRLMGHKNINSTMIYMHFTPEHLKDAIGKLNFDPPKLTHG